MAITDVCQCNRICNGKGLGNGDGDCKKVTIAVFMMVKRSLLVLCEITTKYCSRLHKFVHSRKRKTNST